MSRILLFDIDGTLVSTGGAGRKAVARAMGEILRVEAVDFAFSFAGMTDRAIIRQGLAAYGHHGDREEIDAVITRYVEYLAEEIDQASYVVFPGVLELLDALAGHGGLAIGLGTGNAEKGARIKLEPGGLNVFFPFGGFGCASEERALVLRQGAERGASLLGRDIDTCEVIVIGDTPKDVAAAVAIGARSIAVATGGSSMELLGSCGPDLLVEDLTDPRALDALIAGFDS
jgi:phosphoglycolate phosphatase